MVGVTTQHLRECTLKQIAIALFMTLTLVACSGNDFELDTESGTGSGSLGNVTGATTTGGSTPGGSGSASPNGTPTAGSGDTSQPVAGGNQGGGSQPAAGGNQGGGASGLVAGEITASHRNGQTFIVWREAGDGIDYHVYRHTSPINSGNIGSALRLTDRWGPLDQNTSVNRFGSPDVPTNFVIRDGGQPLADNQGLFVHTTQNDQQGNAYYAVTSVVGGREEIVLATDQNSTSQPVFESVGTPRPVLTLSVNGGRGRVYTQYMDYAEWNPTLNGYAFNFAMALPGDFDPSRTYPLRMYLHAFGEFHMFVEETQFDWPVIQLFPSDPGNRVGTTHTWWYGHARDHNYQTDGGIPSSGVVENFTEQRVLAAVDFMLDNSEFNIDRDLTHIYGHSMGASGALTYGMRYPSVFAGIYASEPMTDYPASPQFQENFTRLWGTQSTNLPIVNNGRNNASIRDFDSNGSQPTRVWNWMNHQEQLLRRRGDRMAYLMVDHGKADRTIDWQTQGRPITNVFTNARVGFSAIQLGGVGHSWLSFGSIVHTVFGFGFDDEAAWRYPVDLSFPGIHNASGSGSLQPSEFGDDRHNTEIEWATPINNFHQSIVDTANTYEISIRSTSVNQTADITPRNTNSFLPGAGTRCSWTARSISNNSVVGSGNSTVDADRLLTIPAVSILAGSGTRLAINCP